MAKVVDGEPVKFEIDGVSSEDPAHPAKGLLLASHDDSGWTSDSGGSSQEFVILKLERPCRISSIRVTNNFSAFIEVSGQEESPEDPDDTAETNGTSSKSWKVLVAKSSLMTPIDSRKNQNGSTERELALKPEVADTQWKSVKFVCQQPFNKDLSYGLSKIEILSPKSVQNGNISLKKSDKTQPIKPGDLFSNTKATSSFSSSSTTQTTVPDVAAVKANSDKEDSRELVENCLPKVVLADQPVSLAGAMKPLTVGKKSADAPTSKSDNKGKSNATAGNVKKRKKSSGSGDDEDDNEAGPSTRPAKSKPGKKGKAKSSSSSGSKRKKDDDEVEADEEDAASTKQPARRGAKSSNTNAIMKGCIFALSGFVNPLRGELREKACSMGAKYRPDWSPECTHLICAFPGTPKFNQVRSAGGRIVKKEWVLDCFNGKRMIPWRTYMLKPAKADSGDDDDDEMEEAKFEEEDEWEPDEDDSSAEESEDGDDEEEHEVHSDELEDDESGVNDEDLSDVIVTDEELDEDAFSDDSSKAKGKAKKKSAAKPKPLKRRRGGVKFDEPDSEEEDEEELHLTDSEEADIDEKNFVPRQRPLFRNMHFFLFGDFVDKEEDKLKQIIKELAGSVRDYNDESVTHCVTALDWCSEFDEVATENPGLIFVSPKWVYDCQEKRNVLDPRPFKPKKSTSGGV